MKSKIFFFSIISIFLTLVYCQSLFNLNGMVGGIYFVHDIAKTDNYQTIATIITNMQLIQAGHFPFGTFWLPNYYGGAVATFLHISFIPNIGGSSLLLVSLITDNAFFAFEIVVFGLLLFAQLSTYKLAKFYFNNASIAWIVAIAFSFSTFLFTHINNGVLDFVAAAAFIPFGILMCEKLFVDPNRKNMAFAVISMLLVFFCDLQLTIFTFYFLILRLLFRLVVNRKSSNNIEIIKRVMEGAGIFGLTVAPFIISFSLVQNTGALAVPSIPSYYLVSPSLFFTGTVDIALHETASYYLGVVTLALAFIPVVFSNKLEKSDSRNFFFFITAVIFFFLIAIGTPLSTLVTTFFVRVPSRVQILLALSLAICAGYGLKILINIIKQKLGNRHIINRNRTIRLGMAVVLATIIFIDCTSGITLLPVNNAVPQLTGGSQFIKEQLGDFRVLEYPTVWGYTDYESQILGHEIVGIGIIALRAYPPSSEIFGDLSTKFQNIENHFNETDPGNLTALATVCGVKYVLIQTNYPDAEQFIGYFNNATSYFTKVYSDANSTVYENHHFKGTAFVVKDTGNLHSINDLTIEKIDNLTLSDTSVICTKSFNKIEVSVNVSEPSFLVLSQSYYPYWVLTDNGGKSNQFVNYLNVTGISLERGTHNFVAVFAISDQTNVFYAVSLITLFLFCLSIFLDQKKKIHYLQVVLSLLLLYGIIIMALSLQTSDNLTFFGPFSRTVFIIGAFTALIAIFVFIKNKVFRILNSVFGRIRQIQLYVKKSFHLSNAIFDLKLNQIKLISYARFLDILIACLATLAIISIVLLNLFPFSFDVTTGWLKDGLLWTFVIVFLSYTIKYIITEYKTRHQTAAVLNTKDSINLADEPKIQYLNYGLIGGLVSVFVVGIFARMLVLYTTEFIGSILILCGSLSGIAFGVLTRGNKRSRGLIALVLGVFSIVLTILIIYSTPIVVGAIIDKSGEPLAPIYKWQQYGFTKFIQLELLNMDTLFSTLIGLSIGYISGAYLSLPNFKKKNSF